MPLPIARKFNIQSLEITRELKALSSEEVERGERGGWITTASSNKVQNFELKPLSFKGVEKGRGGRGGRVDCHRQ